MNNLKFLFVALFVVSGLRSNGQQTYGSIADFQVLPQHLINGKIRIDGNKTSTLVKYKATFYRVRETNSSSWKPFGMTITLGMRDASGNLVSFGSGYYVDYNPATPSGVFEREYSVYISNSKLINGQQIGVIYTDRNAQGGGYGTYFWTPITYDFEIVSSSNSLSTMVGIDIASDDHVYYWNSNSMVSSGYSTSLQDYRTPYAYSAASNKSVSNIIGMAIGNSDACYAWYADGTVSSGYSNLLGQYSAPTNFILPSGRSITDIVGITINRNNNYCYTYYKDGTGSIGTPTNLGSHTTSFSYSISPYNTYDKIVDIGIAPSSGRFYAWYSDGTMSVGNSSSNLADYIPHKAMNL